MILDTLSFLTSSGDTFGNICGAESYSQHLYMDTGVETGDTLTISFSINNAPTSTSNRYWSIRVIQVKKYILTRLYFFFFKAFIDSGVLET